MSAAPADPRRLFVALMVGPAGAEVLAAVVAALGGEAEAHRRHRLPRGDGLHLTLFFLGDVAAPAIDGLCAELAGALAAAAAPRLRLARAGAFPRPGHERVLWVGVEEEGGEGRLAALHRSVLAAVARAGFDPGEEVRRPFRAHVTVGRPRDPRRPGVPAAFYALAADRPWRPREAALVESVAAAGPNLYRPLAVFPLRE
ncbi:MAG: RNA 2',3'-cyclic phosphodiesterase [Planctomycetota bacterium]